jgi:hypothetical protein
MAAAQKNQHDGGSVDQNGSQSAPASSDQSAPDPMANAIPDTDSARGVGGKQPEKLERSFIDVKGSSVKDRDHLALHITDANKLYEKESPSDAELKAALADYSWAADNWNDCNATTDQNTDWDHALCESRLADCNLLTGQVEQALPHYKAANELWKKCGQPALQNVSMAGLYVAYCESKLKVAQSESTSATWDNLKTAFADNKYLGVVTQDWSNVQWNNGSPMDAEVSRIQAFMERMDASKKPYAGLPLAKPQQS